MHVKNSEKVRILGVWRGRLPKGCELCMKGLKVVVYVTGFCEANCFYCPLSTERRNPRSFYVDEERINNIENVVLEVEAVGARGASITGGEPLASIERVENIISLLKDVYGDKFHIHLYTHGGHLTPDIIRRLDRLGLDELRFHPRYERSFKYLEYATRNTSMEVGVEVPAIPGRVAELTKLVERTWLAGAKFININELEYSETNLAKLLIRGLKPAAGKPYVLGSFETALQVLRYVEEKGLDISVHICPAVFKDAVQMRLRLIRKALATAAPHEEVTPSGTLRSLRIPNDLYDRLSRYLPQLPALSHPADGKYIYVNPRVLDLLPKELREEVESRGIYEERYPSILSSYSLVTKEVGARGQ
ncbi:MAG: radical SAM protein [Thermoprotei archaeon]|nr:MAG: radical SAM protein [Thermoprotei archaeon]